mmetsp:Transcript_150050/g.364522  ORF Transcript_150050/g.364522 Transcript_150050/m.364522 type:complete len:546 (-) Transcript_150050:70-1707(-)
MGITLLRILTSLVQLAPLLQVGADWALTESELSAARGGVPRAGLAQLTKENAVTPLIDGKAFLGQLYPAIEATQKGDFVHAAAFSLTGDVLLVPNASAADDGKSTGLLETLQRALQRGVHMRMLVNANLYMMPGAVKFCHSVNQYCPWTSPCCIPETRHHSIAGNLHTKYWVIQRSGEAIAFLGGMDAAGGRYDTPLHNSDAEREAEPAEYQPFWGWHDNMFLIRGPAVRDVARHFWALWNDPVPALYSAQRFDWVQPPVANGVGSVEVQTLMTASCQGAANKGMYSLFAERGETSFAAAFYKMVGSARRYLYIEDQFVFFPEAMAAVAEALPRLEAVIIVTDDASVFDVKFHGLDIKIGVDLRRHTQYKSLRLLTENATLAQKVHIFTLKRPGVAHPTEVSDVIYIHSKNYIADDEYAIVGSAGIERAGFTSDLDLAVGLRGGGLVRSLRRRLWAEHLDVEEADPRLDEPAAAARLWEERAESPEARVARYFPEGPMESYWLLEEAYGLYEPDGRCQTRAAVGDATLPNRNAAALPSLAKLVLV